mmetsp:Transcript_5391/g.10527  ORF Transcript_5391/g.10527 Transcript_5391/m.10527 type:complete len:160 (-) Transcript_5391:190-669(-)
MVNAREALALLLVGALWGCTNPFMRQGLEDGKESRQNNSDKNETKISDGTGKTKITLESISRLARVKVWLPYIINQFGSLLYYKVLASSNLTLSVPICNATAMVFSSITSVLLGEKLNHPGKAVLGVILVLSGVAICMYSSGERLKAEDRSVKSWNEEL